MGQVQVSLPISEHTKHVADVASIGTMLAALAGWLPAIAALLTIIWTAIRIVETDTVQRLWKRWKNRKKTG